MTGKIFTRTLCCLFVALLACGTAFAQGGKLKSGPYKGTMVPMREATDAAPFYSNLAVNTCTGCNYSADNGYLVLGPANCGIPGATQWLAFPFVSARTGPVKKISLAVTDWGVCVSSMKQVTVAIYSDGCAGVPGTQIGSSKPANIPAAPCLAAQANMNGTGVSLTAGTTYWVVVTTAANQTGTTAVWWMANSAQAPFNLDDGNGWVAFPDGAPGGFAVQ